LPVAARDLAAELPEGLVVSDVQLVILGFGGMAVVLEPHLHLLGILAGRGRRVHGDVDVPFVVGARVEIGVLDEIRGVLRAAQGDVRLHA
jgi:hypothetical protein